VREHITIDTGPITLLFAEDVPEKVSSLFMRIIKGEYYAHVIPPVIAEAYKHICVLRGNQIAQSSMAMILNDYPITLVEMTPSLTFKAGSLKCRFRDTLSNTDCFVIAHALLMNAELHTTEKDLPPIPSLKLRKYAFD
jgi:predicted nucleic acid-binding protein